MKVTFLIVAGGSGSRMKADVPKQFIPLSGLPILMRVIKKFRDFDASYPIIVVLPESQFSHWKSLCAEYQFNIPHKLVAGGDTRFESVRNGLQEVENDGLVAIHDGVRPLVSQELIWQTLGSALEYGNAIPVMPLSESIRELDYGENRAVDRTRFVSVQTPQVFRAKEIKEAYQEATRIDFTDDATVLESYGFSINLVEGERNNLKITTPFDLQLAELLLHQSESFR